MADGSQGKKAPGRRPFMRRRSRSDMQALHRKVAAMMVYEAATASQAADACGIPAFRIASVVDGSSPHLPADLAACLRHRHDVERRGVEAAPAAAEDEVARLRHTVLDQAVELADLRRRAARR